MMTFAQAKKRNLDKLKLFVPVVARVHGEHHPEFHEVRKVYDEMIAKINQSDSEAPDLESEFSHLRELTDRYTVPGDVCESYEAVYVMLSELDEAYHG